MEGCHGWQVALLLGRGRLGLCLTGEGAYALPMAPEAAAWASKAGDHVLPVSFSCPPPESPPASPTRAIQAFRGHRHLPKLSFGFLV
jgi:hypothetical protein